MNTPACFFPTQTLLVDDNQSFLDALSLRLKAQHPCATSIDPTHALKKLQPLSDLMQMILPQTDTPDTFSVMQSLSAIEGKEKYTSVVIVDYSMPGMNGLALLEQMAHIPVKKIMLTGQADLEGVTNAI